MSLGYDPKTSSVTVQYKVYKAGVPWFLPERWPDGNLSAQLLQCAKLSPQGVESIAPPS